MITIDLRVSVEFELRVRSISNIFFLFYFQNDMRHLSYFGKGATGKDEVFEQGWI